MIHIEYFTFNSFREHCFVLWDETGTCVIADPGAESQEETDEITALISAKGLTPACIMLTHGHFDHVYGMSRLCKKYGIPVYMHEKEMFTLSTSNPALCRTFGLPAADTYPFDGSEATDGFARFIKEGDTVNAGNMSFEVMETPGHTPGGVCYIERKAKVLISGDTLFAGSIGRTDHPGGDYDMLMSGIFGKLMTLDGDIKVFPGHGPDTTIADERTKNPFLMPFNEPYEE
ncbi:MAG: MBL fold metallo-hydrolase [Bacteroidales bacterium]|nr:MBL fold metallo-hydrolase [Bacteroidales bacterium]